MLYNAFAEEIDSEKNRSRQLTPELPCADYNTVSEAQLVFVKKRMDTAFQRHEVRPGDDNYVYDKRIVYDSVQTPSDWDDEIWCFVLEWSIFAVLIRRTYLRTSIQEVVSSALAWNLADSRQLLRISIINTVHIRTMGINSVVSMQLLVSPCGTQLGSRDSDRLWLYWNA